MTSVRPGNVAVTTRASAEGVVLNAAIAGKATLAINMFIKSEKAEQTDRRRFYAIRHGSSSGEVAYRIGPRYG